MPGRAEMPVWTGDGSHLLMISGDALWAVPIAAGKPSGAAVVVKQGLTSGEPLGMTPAGTYYYRETPAGVRWLSIRDVDTSGTAPASAPRQTNFGLGGIGPLWSPTGSSISYMRLASATEPATVVVRSVESGTEKVFRGLWPVAWFRVGRQLLVNVDARTAPNGTFFSVRQPFASLDVETGELTRLPLPPMHRGGVLSPDDQTLYISEGMKVVAFDLRTGQQRDVYRAAVPPGMSGLALSPRRPMARRPGGQSRRAGGSGRKRCASHCHSPHPSRAEWPGPEMVKPCWPLRPLTRWTVPSFELTSPTGAVAPTGRSGPDGHVHSVIAVPRRLPCRSAGVGGRRSKARTLRNRQRGGLLESRQIEARSRWTSTACSATSTLLLRGGPYGAEREAPSLRRYTIIGSHDDQRQ